MGKILGILEEIWEFRRDFGNSARFLLITMIVENRDGIKPEREEEARAWRQKFGMEGGIWGGKIWEHLGDFGIWDRFGIWGHFGILGILGNFGIWGHFGDFGQFWVLGPSGDFGIIW